MQKIIKSFLVLSAMSLAAFGNIEGALPPIHQSIKEYKALIESPELSQQLGTGEGITEIQRVENGFVVKSFHKTLNVEVVYDQQDRPGAVKFHLVFHTPETLYE